MMVRAAQQYTHLASVSSALLNAGTHHVIADVQFHFVRNLLIEAVTQATVDHGDDHMLYHARYLARCIQ